MFARSIPFLALIAQLVFSQAHAKELALKIDYNSTATGTDGVTRTTRYSDKLIRRDNDSWFARVLPAHAHDEDEHAKGGKGHKHLDTTAAARWVTRQEDGKLQVRLVSTHEKMVVDIPKAEYSAIDALKQRAVKMGLSPKKSELLRAGLALLAATSEAAFRKALGNVPTLKTGRPGKA